MAFDREKFFGPLPTKVIDVGLDDQSSPSAVVLVMKCCQHECSDPILFTIADPDLADDVAVSLVRGAQMLRDAQIRRSS